MWRTHIHLRQNVSHTHSRNRNIQLGAVSSNPKIWCRNQEFRTYLLFFCHPRHVVISQRHITENRNPKTPENWSKRGPEESKISYNSNRESQPHAIICAILRLFRISTVYQIAIVLHGPSIGHSFGWLPSLSAKRYFSPPIFVHPKDWTSWVGRTSVRLLDVLCIYKVRSETENILEITWKYNIQEKIQGS
jgi:hypothetical protein